MSLSASNWYWLLEFHMTSTCPNERTLLSVSNSYRQFPCIPSYDEVVSAFTSQDSQSPGDVLQLTAQYLRTCVPVSERFDPRACSLPPILPDSTDNDALVVHPSYTGQRVVWCWQLKLPIWRMSPHRANGTQLLDYVIPKVNYPHMQLLFCSWYYGWGLLGPLWCNLHLQHTNVPNMKYWTV